MTWKHGDDAPGWAERTITPDCGHTVTVSGMGSGYAIERDTGRTRCYSCADESERATMADSASHVAYVAGDGKSVTTWSGGRLARVTGHTTARNGWHRSIIHRWWAIAPDGSAWYGANSGQGMAIRMRRIKGDS